MARRKSPKKSPFRIKMKITFPMRLDTDEEWLERTYHVEGEEQCLGLLEDTIQEIKYIRKQRENWSREDAERILKEQQEQRAAI